ncbi:hypothetical protein [Petropleomorpha daqingensis]|uniref:Uncharacterized protein n=1 Tax=Petropleomorpha daqingensis TaxID=2026353 RepID=A0A853CC40_9ACTN|nr:hypothetical protein [Petropleomorpha daqingensis]NYJ03958.1 hypothetical protein [Petropleomorpha daqingensis]
MTALDDAPLVALSRAAVLGRLTAVLGLASAAVHILVLDTAELGSLVMVGMAAVCLPCAWHLWRHPTPAVWATTATLDAAMLLLHAQMLAAMTHHSAAHPHGLMWTGLALVTSQLVLAGAAALRR